MESTQTTLQSLRQKVTLPTIVLGIVLSAIYLYFFAFKAHVELEINMHHKGRAWLKVYWADENASYNENNMRQIRINSDEERYSVLIDGLGRAKRIRLDPVEFQTSLTLKKIKITQPGYQRNEVSWVYGFKDIKPLQQIDNLRQTELGLEFDTTGDDGQLEYLLDTKTGTYIPITQIVIVLCIFLATLIAGRVLGPLQKKLAFVPALMLIATFLILIMAVISKHYTPHPSGVRLFVHPDEEAHVVGVEYYHEHFLPPTIDSPLIANTFSVYGYSRLSSDELYYPIVGYMTRLLAPFKQTVITNARLIGVFFFLLLVIFAYRRETFRPFVLPLLISPQIWYLYSYTNSDGFAILLATIAAYQAAYKESTMNKLLSQQHPERFIFNSVWLGLLIGALLLLKLNFYVFILFLGLYLIWRIAINDFPNQKLLWKRLTLLVIIGVSIYGARVGLDYAINGLDSKQKIADMSEQKAAPAYRRSTPILKRHLQIYMKERGVTLSNMIHKERWGGKTYLSSFGSYGFTQFFAGDTYFNIVRIVGLLTVGLLLFSILLRGPRSLHWLFMITLGCAGLILFLSFWRSWTISFQPQGRYLIPVLPMLGILYYHSREWLFERTFNALIVAMFALGVYSFIFYGLALIPKAV